MSDPRPQRPRPDVFFSTPDGLRIAAEFKRWASREEGYTRRQLMQYIQSFKARDPEEAWFVLASLEEARDSLRNEGQASPTATALTFTGVGTATSTTGWNRRGWDVQTKIAFLSLLITILSLFQGMQAANVSPIDIDVTINNVIGQIDQSAPALTTPSAAVPPAIEQILKRFERFNPKTLARQTYFAMVGRGYSAFPSPSGSRQAYIRMIYHGLSAKAVLYMDSAGLVSDKSAQTTFAASRPFAHPAPNGSRVRFRFAEHGDPALQSLIGSFVDWADGLTTA